MDANNFDFSCFKAYDIRGRVPEELNPELARAVGLAFAAEYRPGAVCIGRDMRLSSDSLAEALTAGFREGGVDVIDLGLCGTEEVYHAVFSQGFGGGVMITASHNPADWNGLKLVREKSIPLSGDSGLLDLKRRIKDGDLPKKGKTGAYLKQSFRQEYLDCLLCLADLKNLKPMTLVADAGNGCAWQVMQGLLPHLPDKVIGLNVEPDGTFPNGVPNPLLPERRESTSLAVLEHGAEFGIAWDGDFDRCFFYDRQGRFIESYYMIAILAEELLSSPARAGENEGAGEKILHDTRLIWNTREAVTRAGGIPVEAKTGHAFMKERLRAENALYGAEMSAHHYFRDFGYCDSGMLPWLLLRRIMGRTGKSLAEMVEDAMRKYPVSGEINREVKDPAAAMRRIRARYQKAAFDINFIDGLSMDMGSWRLNVRMSNTEPLLRLNVESRGDAELVREKTGEILSMMV